MTVLPLEMLDRPVNGTGLNTGPHGRRALRDQLDPARPTMLVFLRHFGCIFCREMVKDIRTAADRADHVANGATRRYPRVLFVHQGTPEQGEEFFGGYWPGAPAISDPDRSLYAAMGVGQGGLLQTLGPRVWACGLRAALKGHSQGRTVGDPWTMPGLVIVGPDGAILQTHRFRHAGDHPDFASFTDLRLPAPQRPA